MRHNTTLVVPESELLQQKVILPDGRVAQVDTITDAAFRDWLYAFITQCCKQLKSTMRQRVRSIRAEARVMRMDDTARWYLLNELYRQPDVRECGVTLFVESVKSEAQAS